MQRFRERIPRRLDRRTGILLTLLALLVLSSIANYQLGLSARGGQTSLPVSRVLGAQPTQAPTPTAGPKDTGSAFADYRNERGATRAQEIAMLDEMIADKAAGDDMANQAREQKLAFVRALEQEASLEGLLKARGYEDALVSVQPGAVTVVVKRESLTSAEATQILDMAARETGSQARDIKIIPTK
ncbi:MAG: SpoIIIAH-like family protein [Oscillospiraceae bacterium]|nr:SpoIIIAH-like family protein [Oscillospiraceae bacterium]